MMARRQIERAQVAVLVIDASQGVTSGDLAIAGTIWELGRAAVVAINKWDLLDEEKREKLEFSSERLDELLSGPGRVNVSALSGRGIEKLWGPIDRALKAYHIKLSTGAAQPALRGAIKKVAPPSLGGALEALLHDPGLDGAADLHAVREPARCRATTTTGATWRTACARSWTCPACPCGWWSASGRRIDGHAVRTSLDALAAIAPRLALHARTSAGSEPA